MSARYFRVCVPQCVQARQRPPSHATKCASHAANGWEMTRAQLKKVACAELEFAPSVVVARPKKSIQAGLPTTGPKSHHTRPRSRPGLGVGRSRVSLAPMFLGQADVLGSASLFRRTGRDLHRRSCSCRNKSWNKLMSCRATMFWRISC